MLIYLLFLILITVFIKNFKRGIIVYAPFKFMFSHGIPSHIGKFELDAFFTLCLFLLWLLKNNDSLGKNPLRRSLVIMFVASFIYACNPQFAIITLVDSLSPFLYFIMFFDAIKNEADLKLFIKVICGYVLLLNGNAICELAGNNIIGSQLLTIMYPKTYWAVDAGTRGLFIRLHSFVPHSIGYGVENMVFFSFFLMLYVYGQNLLKKKKSMFYMGVCLLGIFLSGSRSPLLGGVVILLPLIANRKMFNAQNFAFVVMASVVIVYFGGAYLSTMFDSLTTDSNTDMGGASSWDMRLGQLEYSVYFWMQNFWFGNGHNFDIFQGGKMYSQIFGAESVWFPIMMKQGLVGMVAYLYITIDACFCAIKVDKKAICLCLMLGWLIIDSATNLPGLSILLPLYFYTVYYKWDNLLKSKNYDFNNNTNLQGRTIP